MDPAVDAALPVPTRLAGYLTLAAAAMYVFGFVHLTYWATPRETCIVRYGTWDGRYGHASYWPLERKCADDIDMVPGYVNPLIVILLTGALTCALIAVVQLVRHRRVGFALGHDTRSPTSRPGVRTDDPT
ncbi:hypothetical protein GCM10027614_39340 [Micromonospora vulcania]